MTHDRSPSVDPELTRALRLLYAAPTSDRYWDMLEARILAQVTSRDGVSVWWSELPELMRPGMIAAAALMLSAAFAVMHSRQTAARNAYASVISPTPSSIEIARSTVGDGDAAIRDLLSH